MKIIYQILQCDTKDTKDFHIKDKIEYSSEEDALFRITELLRNNRSSIYEQYSIIKIYKNE